MSTLLEDMIKNRKQQLEEKVKKWQPKDPGEADLIEDNEDNPEYETGIEIHPKDD